MVEKKTDKVDDEVALYDLSSDDIEIIEPEDLKKLLSSSTFSFLARTFFRVYQYFRDPWLPFSGVWRVKKSLASLSPSCWLSYGSNPDSSQESLESKSVIRILWRGVWNSSESMGVVSSKMTEALLSSPNTVVIQQPFTKAEWPTQTDINTSPINEPFDLEVQVPGFYKANQSTPVVRFVFSEFGFIEKSLIREQDIIWVPSVWCRFVLKNAGLKNTIVVIPHGVDLDLFKPQNATDKKQNGKTVRFLYVGTCLSRKGFDIVLSAWKRLNPGNATLTLKIMPTMTGFVSSMLKELPDNVSLITDIMTPEQLACLYQNSDVLLAPSRAEGFGLPILEALACATPVIIPKYSAMTDFCNEACAFLIDAKIVRIPWFGGQQAIFHEPDLNSLCEIIDKIVTNPEILIPMREASVNAATKFSWEFAATKMLQEIARWEYRS
jgi:glycosyltransferase involved in cell wall biosynthesis